MRRRLDAGVTAAAAERDAGLGAGCRLASCAEVCTWRQTDSVTVPTSPGVTTLAKGNSFVMCLRREVSGDSRVAVCLYSARLEVVQVKFPAGPARWPD